MITITNDEKGKRQSFEANITIEESSSNGHYYISLIGYGASEKEAKVNLIEQVRDVMDKLKDSYIY
jgi:hypothetical protein